MRIALGRRAEILVRNNRRVHIGKLQLIAMYATLPEVCQLILHANSREFWPFPRYRGSKRNNGAR